MVSPFGPTAETTVFEPDVDERAWTAAELLASVIDGNAGVVCGLLSGDGWHDVIVTSPWRMSADAQHSDYVRGILISELARIVLPAAALLWLTLTHRFWRMWPALIASTVASGGLSILLWYGLTRVTSGAQL